MVVAYHMIWSPGFGWMAIQMFFVLSGFLISRMLLVEQHLPLGQALKLFYWRRALRILPVLLIYLGVLYLLSWFIPALASSREMLGWAALYVHNIALMLGWDAGLSPAGVYATQHLWSMATEEHFYLFWPVLFLLAGPRLRGALVVTMIVAAPVVRYLLATYWTDPGETGRAIGKVVYVFSGSHVDAFAMGAGITLLGQHPVLKGFRVWHFLLACVAIAALGILVDPAVQMPRGFTELREFAYGYPLHMDSAGKAVWGYTMVNLVAVMLFVLAVHHPRVNRLFDIAFMRQTGRVSYSLYLVHQPILYGFYQLMPMVSEAIGSRRIAIVLMSGIFLVLIYALAHLMHRYIEQPFMRLKPRHRIPPPDVPSATASTDRDTLAPARAPQT